MLVMRTTENAAYPLGELVGSQHPVGLYNLALAVDPFRFDGVQPRTLLGQKATYDPHSFAALLDAAVVRSEPAPDLLGDVPGGIVPDQDHELLTKSFEPLQAPLKEPGRYGTDGPAVHEPQPRIAEFGQVEPVAGDGFRLRIILGDRPLDKAKRLALLGPTAQGGQRHPAPPAFVQETHRPGLGVGLGHFHQSVAPPFFLS